MERWKSKVACGIEAFERIKDKERRVQERLAISEKPRYREKLQCYLAVLHDQAHRMNVEIVELLQSCPDTASVAKRWRRYH